MNINTGKAFEGFSKKISEDLARRFQTVDSVISSISIGRQKDSALGGGNSGGGGFKIPLGMTSQGVYMNCDTASGKSHWANPQRPALVVDSPDAVLARIQDALADGKTQDSIREDIQTYMRYDRDRGAYVVTPVIKGVNDSMIAGTAIPHWNIGYLNKIFKQPFTTSFAKNLVVKEGFGNPWADVLAIFLESFEGFGRISNAAKGTVEMNSSNPVTSQMQQMMTDVVNLVVDYETSIEENMRAGSQKGNFLSSVAIADRERYANMVLDRIHDALIIFGNQESGTLGLIDIAGEENYTGTPIDDIVNDVSNVTKGADIVEAMNGIIGEFLRENFYLPKKLKINCSTYVMKGMLNTSYSKGYSPDSPMQTISGRFDSKNSTGGGLQTCEWTLVADPMLDPSTPFNTDNSDLFIMTVPEADSALGAQQGLVIAPTPLDQFIVPPMYQRGGFLYTMIKRVGGILAPIEGTIKVIRGFGYQGS